MNRKPLTSRSVPVLLLLSAFVSCGFGPASTAVNRVREGIRHFANGDYAAAVRAFTEADVAEPENPVIAFDRACALSASGDHDKATEFFLQAALAREIDLAANAHYNLGGLSAERGRETLGEDPVAATPEQRQQGLAYLLTAVTHYRDVLKLDPEHADARHNLELIRLFIKNIQAQWEQRDREKDREEMGLLEFLAMIEQRQAALRSAVRLLDKEPDSPQRRQAATETAHAQSELQEEIEPLREKITEEFQAAQQAQAANAQPGNTPPDDSESEQALMLLTQLANEAGDLMTAAATGTEASDFTDADEKQREVLDRLNQIFMAVAPFSNILQRAIPQQEQLTTTSEAAAESDEITNDDEGTESTEETDAASVSKDVSEPVNREPADADFPELQWQQNQVTDWSRMLSLKAQSELPGVETQLQAAQSQKPSPDDATSPPDDDPAGAQQDPPDPAAQLKGLKESLEKAIELGPKVVEHSTSAAAQLGDSKVTEALPDQKEALKLLREIAESLSQQNQPQDDQQDGDGDNQNQQPQDQNQQPSDQNKDQNQDERQKEQQSQQERAMSVLRRARERERQHRDLQKQLQELVGGRVRVDRDW